MKTLNKTFVIRHRVNTSEKVNDFNDYPYPTRARTRYPYGYYVPSGIYTQFHAPGPLRLGLRGRVLERSCVQKKMRFRIK